MFVFTTLQTYNLSLNIRYFLIYWKKDYNHLALKKNIICRSMNVQNCKYLSFWNSDL